MIDAVGKRSVICQGCKYARHNLGEIAAECKAVRHMLARKHSVHEMADGIKIKSYDPPLVYTGDAPPF